MEMEMDTQTLLTVACAILLFPLFIWSFIPKLFRILHKALQDSLQLLPMSSTSQPYSYDKSVWDALEVPTRYLLVFVYFSQIGLLIVPTVVTKYISQSWREAVVFSVIWFLYRWKINFFSKRDLMELHEEKLIAVDKLLSLGLIALGVIRLAEALDLPMQTTIITACGIGGLAAIFVTRDIFSNLFSGLYLQFSKPFGVGDNIKVGSVEGQVVEMGVTTTSLIDPKMSFMIVPNSFFSNQVIVNESRAQLCASLIKLPVRIEDIEKIPLISEEIKIMLEGYPKVFLGRDAPYCYLSRIEDSFAELVLGYNLERMRKDELFAAEQDILLQAARIIRLHGAELGRA